MTEEHPTHAIGEWVHVSTLEPWSGNYNLHSREQLDALKAAVGEHGWGAPILAHRETRRVVDGHGRLEVAIELLAESGGTWQLADAPAPGLVPVRWRDGTWEACEKEAIAANLIPRASKFDEPQLGRVLLAIAAREGGLAERTTLALGLDRGRAADLVRLARPNLAATVQDPPEILPPKRPKSKVGEVYQLGPHRLRCGESLDIAGIRELLGDEPADLAFTDPPYAIYGSSTGIGRDIADDGMIRPFFSDIMLHLSASLRLFGLAWVCCDWRSWPSWFEVAKGTDMAVKNLIVWDKGGAGLGNQYAQTYEEIGFFVKSPIERAFMSTRKTGIRGVHAGNVFHIEGEPLADGEPKPREAEGDPGLVYGDPMAAGDGTARGLVLRENRVQGAERVHNAQKPVALIMAILKPAIRPDEVILDLFAGSGSTLIAAERLGLRARLSERSPAWCDVIRKRWTIFARELGADPGTGALE